MKLRFLTFGLLAFLLAGLNACKKTDIATESTGLSQDIQNRIRDLGFNPDGGYGCEGGYIVEGDIFLSTQDLQEAHSDIHALIVAGIEQYRTTNLVTGLPRNIKVHISTTLPSAYVAALDLAIARYNAEGLLVTMTRTTNSNTANIKIKKAPNGASYLASAGFPSGGNPYNQVLVNSTYLGNNPGDAYLATILAHEMGHCIGFRHTDYMDRSYSCGGAFYNEGSAGVGAINIPGTPTGPDANSWMLACIGSGQDRPFNANDKTALNYLY